MDINNTILSQKKSSPGYNELHAYIAKQCIDIYVTDLYNQHVIDGRHFPI